MDARPAPETAGCAHRRSYRPAPALSRAMAGSWRRRTTSTPPRMPPAASASRRGAYYSIQISLFFSGQQHRHHQSDGAVAGQAYLRRMGVGHASDDGQTQAATPDGIAVGAIKAIEQTFVLRLRHAGAVVGHLQ